MTKAKTQGKTPQENSGIKKLPELQRQSDKNSNKSDMLSARENAKEEEKEIKGDVITFNSSKSQRGTSPEEPPAPSGQVDNINLTKNKTKGRTSKENSDTPKLSS